VDAIVQVVRCFEDEDVHHVSGTVDPVRDIEVINTELMLSDLETATRKRERVAKEAKRGDKDAIAEEAVLAKLIEALDAGRPALTVALTPEERAIAKQFFLLSDKPTIFACNVKDGDLADADANPYVVKVREYVRTHLSCEAVVISAQIESELIDLSTEEGEAFLKEMGVTESGVGSLIRATYHLLGLQTYFTAGEKEVRAPGPFTPATPLRRRPASSTRTSNAGSSRPRPWPTMPWWPAAPLRRRARRAVSNGRQGVHRQGRRCAALQVQRVDRLRAAGCGRRAAGCRLQAAGFPGEKKPGDGGPSPASTDSDDAAPERRDRHDAVRPGQSAVQPTPGHARQWQSAVQIRTPPASRRSCSGGPGEIDAALRLRQGLAAGGVEVRPRTLVPGHAVPRHRERVVELLGVLRMDAAALLERERLPLGRSLVANRTTRLSLQVYPTSTPFGLRYPDEG
jgi:hypothetical protein